MGYVGSKITGSRLNELLNETARSSNLFLRVVSWGHGVVDVQVGAIGFAKQGKDYKFILKHYYTGVQIKKLY